MLHVVPIVCLIFFIFIVEVRLKEALNALDKEVKNLENNVPNYYSKDEIHTLLGNFMLEIDRKYGTPPNNKENENMCSK